MNRRGFLVIALAVIVGPIAVAQERSPCRVVLPTGSVTDALDAYLVFPEAPQFPTIRGTLVSTSEDHRYAAFEVPDQWSAPPASLAVRATNGDWHILPVPDTALQIDAASCAGKSTLQKLVRGAREDLSEAVARRDDAKAALDRLQADVDVIGNINRIVGTEQLLDERQWELDRTTAVEKALTYKIERLSRQPVPRFQQQRTASLQRYAAAAAKASGPGGKESAELQAATHAMTEKLALIESTKGDHMTLLTRELARLKRERELLEDSLGFSVE